MDRVRLAVSLWKLFLLETICSRQGLREGNNRARCSHSGCTIASMKLTSSIHCTLSSLAFMCGMGEIPMAISSATCCLIQYDSSKLFPQGGSIELPYDMIFSSRGKGRKGFEIVSQYTLACWTKLSIEILNTDEYS